MLGARFTSLFETLIARWNDWLSAPRDPERVPELARARFALEDARAAIAEERETLVGGTHPDGARTSVSVEDRARLRVLGTGYQQN